MISLASFTAEAASSGAIFFVIRLGCVRVPESELLGELALVVFLSFRERGAYLYPG